MLAGHFGAHEEPHGQARPLPAVFRQDGFGIFEEEKYGCIAHEFVPVPIAEDDEMRPEDFGVLPCPDDMFENSAPSKEPPQAFIERVAFELQAHVDDLREGCMTSGQVLTFSNLALAMHKFATECGAAGAGNEADANGLAAAAGMAESPRPQPPVYARVAQQATVSETELARHRKDFERYCTQFEQWHEREQERLWRADVLVELRELRRRAGRGGVPSAEEDNRAEMLAVGNGAVGLV